MISAKEFQKLTIRIIQNAKKQKNIEPSYSLILNKMMFEMLNSLNQRLLEGLSDEKSQTFEIVSIIVKDEIEKEALDELVNLLKEIDIHLMICLSPGNEYKISVRRDDIARI